MAEFCRECFIRYLLPDPMDIPYIVMSEDDDFCEGCGKISPVVLYIDKRSEREKKN